MLSMGTSFQDDSQAKALAVSLWIQSGEGCSLSIDETIGRRLTVPLDTLGGDNQAKGSRCFALDTRRRRVVADHRGSTRPKVGHTCRAPVRAGKKSKQRAQRFRH